MRTALPRIDGRIRQLNAFRVDTITSPGDITTVELLAASYNDTLAKVFGGRDTIEYQRYEMTSLYFSTATLSLSSTKGSQLDAVRTAYKQGIDRAVTTLRAIREGFEEEIAHAPGPPSLATYQPAGWPQQKAQPVPLPVATTQTAIDVPDVADLLNPGPGWSVDGPYIVVVLDICSSSNIIEELAKRGEVGQYALFISALKQWLDIQKQRLDFWNYKFTGDGWILLFPKERRGSIILEFIADFATQVLTEMESHINNDLERDLERTGITAGIDSGRVLKLTLFKEVEFCGRPINVACRLQTAVKSIKDAPTNTVLVSQAAYYKYMATQDLYHIEVTHQPLANIRDGEAFTSILVDLQSPLRPRGQSAQQ